MVFANRPTRSLSVASHQMAPLPSPPVVPFTPTDDAANTSPSGSVTAPFCLPTATPPTTNSPFLSLDSPSGLPVPTNTPASNLDSGVSSPSENKSTRKYLPIYLEAHHFPSPVSTPRVPPNTPESKPFTMSAIDNSIEISEDMSDSLGERLAALSLAKSKKDGVTIEEVKVLKEVIPRAPDNEYYEVRAIPGKGYGCFALKELRPGTRILADSPLLVVTKAEYYQPDIQAAFDKLSSTDQAFYFTLHSAHSQDMANWPSKIHDSVTSRERRRITEQHNARVAKEPSLISIFQTNCMEMGKGAAVFPHTSRFNHSCNPNACFSWNAAIYKETIHIINRVEEGEQITLSYCDMTHDKALRGWELKHYGFVCDCPACGDDKDPASFASKSAERRFRIAELTRDLKAYRGPFLELSIGNEAIINQLLLLATLHMQEGDHTERLSNLFLDIALICEHSKDLLSGRQAAIRALEVKCNYQGRDFPDYPKYEAVLDRIQKVVQAKKGGGLVGQ